MKSLHDIKVFLETAKLGSLSAAARSLDQTPAAISRTIQRLETELGAPLFIRSTRKLRLSPQGEKFLPRCQQAMSIFEQGVSELREDEFELSGTISLSMPSDTGRGVLAPLIDRFIELHPKVSVHLHLSDGYADLYKQNVDLAIRIGKPEDSSMVALPLFKHNYRALVASKSYLDTHPNIASPEDLQQHNCLCFTLHDKWHNRWQFTHQESNQQQLIQVTGNRKSSDGALVRQWAIDGFGVAYKSLLDAHQDLETGKLIQVCEEWQGEHAPLYMVFTDRIQYNAIFKALKVYLEQELERFYSNK
ncbi:transcriptional regulator [Vibrio ishigakensis]|uniref:Transcriptional regulator n=1 Tax=Vibrio ishigakensis TaxID=1481914 RepID=A0A0B8PJW1_9VIBR|nr:transcriptional regulator [Vibrio ishigakensis]